MCFALGCGGVASNAHIGDARPAAVATNGRAFDLVMTTSSCWMGGLWSDALGERYDTRTSGIEARCDAVLDAIHAKPDDAYKPLRAFEPEIVDRIAAKVGDADLEALLHRIANAGRETMYARLVADQVKEDADTHPAPTSYASDKDSAVAPLAMHDALRALLDDHGPYASEAHTLGLLVALDRMEIAHGLPKHLKIAAVGGAFTAVFGVSAPVVSPDGATRAPRGVWLTYLSDVARAGNHPVAASVTSLPDREMLAWSSVLAAFADRLRAEPAYATPQTRLGEVTRDVVTRLDDEYNTAERLKGVASTRTSAIRF